MDRNNASEKENKAEKILKHLGNINTIISVTNNIFKKLLDQGEKRKSEDSKIAKTFDSIHQNVEKIEKNTQDLHKIPSLKTTVIVAILTSFFAGIILTFATYFVINPTLNKLGRMSSSFNKFLRNSTLQGSQLSDKETKDILPQIEKTQILKEAPYIDFIPVGWRQIQDVSGDWGIRAAFIINNYGSKSIWNLQLRDEYYINIDLKTSGVDPINSLLSSQNKELDQGKNNAISLYFNKRKEIIKKVVLFFEAQYIIEMDSKEIQKILENQDIHAQVYGQEKQYYFEPIKLKPKQVYSYEYGRSTGQEWLANAILHEGTYMLIIVSILDYKIESNIDYRSFLVSTSEYENNKVLITTDGYKYNSLKQFKEWYKEL